MESIARPAIYWRPSDVIGVARRGQSYLNLCYLLAAFPLGVAYFIVLVTGLSAGVGLAITLIGIPILAAMVVVWVGLGGFERQLTMWWLGAQIGPMAPPAAPGATLWRRAMSWLSNRVTWTSLLYLFAKFPFGLFTFVLITTLIALSAGLIAAPVPFVIQLVSDGSLSSGQMTLLAVSPLLTLAGLVLGLTTLHICNGLAWAWARFAQYALGMSDEAIRLAEAQRETQRARQVATRAQARAERAEQSRRELIVNASHELRTPIASIRGHVESLLMATEDAAADAPPPAELHGYLAIVARESERLSALVDDLLALARADAGELKLDVRAVEVDGVVREVYEALAPLARRERQVLLVREVPDGLPAALADRQRLTQVLLNLVRNAITYTPEGGIVSITASLPDPAHLDITVSDTGIGIPKEELDHVFERFYRTDASRARASGGFGLGLSIVRDLVRAMGGMVTAESVEGEGSRFHVVLRVATSEKD